MSEPTKAPAPAGRAATKKELPEHFKAYKHVWVFVEQERGQVHPVSWELLGAGRKLADKLKVDLAAVVIGPSGEATRHAAAEAFCYGADLAYVVADDLLTDYRNESYTKALTDVVNTYKPEILLLGATTLGRDLAGSVATTLLTGLTADCTALDVDADGSLAATRPTFGGSLLCTIYTLNYRPQMATVRPRVMPMPERVERDGRPHRRAIRSAWSRTTSSPRCCRSSPTANPPSRISPMPTSWSRAGSGSDRRRISSWCASSPPCSAPNMAVRARWCRRAGSPPTARSARPARPSGRNSTSPPAFPGAIQHRVGVEGADLIVAINTDKNAPIFDFAHVGIVTDAIRLLPALTEAFRARLSPHSRDRIAS